MTRRILGLLSVVAAFALIASAANAAPFPPLDEAAYIDSLAAWNVASPPECLSVQREEVPESSIAGYAGWATIPSPGERVTCSLKIAEGLQPCEVRAVMLHEVGHLLGLSHSSSPTSVMNPDFTLEWICELDYWKAELLASEGKLQSLRHPCPRRGARYEMRVCRSELREQRWDVRTVKHIITSVAMPTLGP